MYQFIEMYRKNLFQTKKLHFLINLVLTPTFTYKKLPRNSKVTHMKIKFLMFKISNKRVSKRIIMPNVQIFVILNRINITICCSCLNCDNLSIYI